jgi:hypothetical protein
MRLHIKFLFALIITLIFSNCLVASNNNVSDSAKICNITNDFYTWYLGSIKEHLDGDFQPRFVQDISGMTTIDYTYYVSHLKKYQFSDSLINNEIESYQTCIGNLSSVKFSDFGKSKYVDLDEYEESECDFTNYYRWIGGQEPIDGIRIKAVKLTSSNNALVTIEYYDLYSKNGRKIYFGENRIEFIKINNIWLVNKIGSWNNK